MPGSALLGDNLIDDLVPTVDELRSELYGEFGVTQREVHIVKRTWSGARRGEGTVSEARLVLDPTPLIVDDDRYRQMPHGRDETGTITLVEVSLTYTEVELNGGAIARNQEFFYEVRELRGQSIATSYYKLASPPSTDRERSIGWRVVLQRIADPAES